jgi:hypothetical protein
MPRSGEASRGSLRSLRASGPEFGSRPAGLDLAHDAGVAEVDARMVWPGSIAPGLRLELCADARRL